MSPPDALRLREILETRSYTAGTPTKVAVAPGGAHVLFLETGPRDNASVLYAFDDATGTARRLAPEEGETESLTADEAARRERQRITGTGVPWYVVSDDGKFVVVPEHGFTVVEIATGARTPVPSSDEAVDPKFSPDGKYVSFVKDYDVWIADRATGSARKVTTGGTADVHHGAAEFVAQEEMKRFSGYWWSPDSKSIAYQETDEREVETAYVGDPSEPTKPPRAFRYPRPGKANAKVRLGIVPIAGGPTRWIDWDRERFPYLAQVVWEEHAPLTVLAQSRDQREEILFTPERELLRETDPAWLNLEPTVPRWLRDGSGFLWISEADGECRLQLRSPDGTLVRVLNPGNEFRLRSLVGIDEDRKVAIVQGSDDPKTNHLWELPLGEDEPLQITDGPGEHVGTYARGTRVRAVTTTSLTAAPSVEVFREDGSSAGALPSQSVPLPAPPNVELVALDTHPSMEAAILRPRDFRAGKKYPTIVHVYGGPSEGEVRESIASAPFVRLQWLADRGYVVVVADNRGLANRGRAFERAIVGDFATTALADQVEALHALAKRYPEIDLDRVGVTGWSFGGFMAALMVSARGDVYHAAVAGAPVVDWLDYDTHYTERYLGLPEANPEGYRKSDVLTYVKDLRRPLLIAHGTADDNVYFLHSLKLANALLRAGKPFEFLPIPGLTHQAPKDPVAGVELDLRTARFFDEALSTSGPKGPPSPGTSSR